MSGVGTVVDNGRRYVRYDLSSIGADYRHRACDVLDISEQGIRLAVAGDIPPADTEVDVTLNVMLLGRTARMLVHGRVVRVGGDQFALNYVAPTSTWPKILKFLDRKEHGAGAPA